MQRDNIVVKILPPITKKINKKYNVAMNQIREMLYMNWRTRNREWRLKMNGDEERDKRRKRKNANMQTVSIVSGIVFI